ncbi:MAG: fructose-bisphosphatase class III [Planctomycetota bacterium]
MNPIAGLDAYYTCGEEGYGVLEEFGGDPEHGWIVNGHVPVRPEKGEKPLKSGGMP